MKTRPEIEAIIGRYSAKLSELGIRAERVVLYGSYAAGTPREDSDIDLLVVSKDFERMNIRERLEVLGVAAARIMEPVQARGYTPGEMEAHSDDPFLTEVLEHLEAVG